MKKTLITFVTLAMIFLGTYDASAQWQYQSSSIWNTIYRYGNVGINGYPSYKFDVKGTFRCYTLYTTSDKRYKKDISPVKDALTKINQLQGVAYTFDPIDYKDESDISEERTIGFLAQEVKEIFPQLVSQDNEGIYSVNYNGIIPVIVEAVKEQHKQVKDQQVEIEQLNQRLLKMEEMLLSSKRKESSLENYNNKQTQGCTLEQNMPNPSNQTTTIKYSTPETAQKVFISIYNFDGKLMLSQSVIPSQNGQVSLAIDQLNNGQYLYSLIVDGQKTITKQMVVLK